MELFSEKKCIVLTGFKRAKNFKKIKNHFHIESALWKALNLKQKLKFLPLVESVCQFQDSLTTNTKERSEYSTVPPKSGMIKVLA